MNRKTHNEALKRINEAYYRMVKCCDHTHEWDRYVGIIQAEEKNHQRFKPESIQNGLTRAQSVRLFAVKNVFDTQIAPEGCAEPFKPRAEDYFHIKAACFAGWAIWALCKPEIQAEFTRDYMRDWLSAVDYAELNRDPQTWKESVAA